MDGTIVPLTFQGRGEEEPADRQRRRVQKVLAGEGADGQRPGAGHLSLRRQRFASRRMRTRADHHQRDVAGDLQEHSFGDKVKERKKSGREIGDRSCKQLFHKGEVGCTVEGKKVDGRKMGGWDVMRNLQLRRRKVLLGDTG